MGEDATSPGEQRPLTDGDGVAGTASTGETTTEADPEPVADVPTWDDGYLDRVADRLMVNYDLERDRRTAGERFDLYARLHAHNRKQFLHPALSFAHHDCYEHVLARRVDSVAVADFERLAALADDLADDWIDADEEHYSTDFTFVLVAPEIPGAVGSFVADFEGRTLLKFGYNGHYEVNLVAAAPEAERLVASPGADVAEAFRLWESIEREEPGWFDRLARRLRR